MRRWLLCALTVLGVAGPASAQEGGDAGAALPDLQQRIDRLRDFEAPAAAEDLAVADSPPDRALTAETMAAYQRTLQAYYDYRQRGYEHRMGVFEWQSFSTKLIFGVVLILVFLGIYFAAIQFHVGLRRGGKAGAADEPEATELVLSVKELKVRSPVLGVIVLAISLAFFYLYLVYVYPIENVF